MRGQLTFGQYGKEITHVTKQAISLSGSSGRRMTSGILNSAASAAGAQGCGLASLNRMRESRRVFQNANAETRDNPPTSIFLEK